MQKYFDEVISVLSKALDSIDDTVFDKLLLECNAAIDSGHKIIVSGLGKNVPICEKFVGTMISLGMPAYFLHTNSAVHGDMGIIADGDLVIILTKSGSTVESVYLTEKLQGRDIDLWLITFSRSSKLSDKIKNTLVIDMEHEGDMWDLVPNNSTTLNLIVLQAIAIKLAQMRKVDIETFHKNHPGGHIGEILDAKN